MKLSIKKTDRRHTGSDIFEYVVDVQQEAIGRRTERIIDFVAVREWCWNTFGSSCEREHWLYLVKFNQPRNERWCWHSDFGNFKIYIRDEKEVNWFKLKWMS